MTIALASLMTVPIALGATLSMRARKAPAISSRQRDTMYRTAFGFAPALPTTRDISHDQRVAARTRPAVLAAAALPYAVSGIFAALSPHQAKQLWTFSCRLLGH